MSKKILVFYFRGERYEVNEDGHIKANGLQEHSPDWIFLGGSQHHWSGRATVTLKDAFAAPKTLNGCLGWDKDHGTMRRWGGRYCGGLPRIQHACVVVKS